MEQRRGQDNPDYAKIRRGWCWGDRKFRKELLAQMRERMGNNHYGEERGTADARVGGRGIVHRAGSEGGCVRVKNTKGRSVDSRCHRRPVDADGGDVQGIVVVEPISSGCRVSRVRREATGTNFTAG